MNGERPVARSDDDRAALPDGLRTALAALRRDLPPAGDPWPEIAARIAAAEAREPAGLTPTLAAELRALRRDVPPPPELWQAVAGRIGSGGSRERDALPAALKDRLAHLPRDVPPARDLWPGIAARTVARPLRRRPWRGLRVALAASLVAAVALVVQIERPLAPVPAAATTSPAKTPLRPSAEAYVATIGGSRRADPELLRARYRPISPEARALVQANLGIVDSAAAQIERAMAEDPDSVPELQSLLDSARLQQAELRAALDAHP